MAISRFRRIIRFSRGRRSVPRRPSNRYRDVVLVSLLGGIGIFLLGMLLLTDGLKGIAGDALKGILTRFVAGPLSGVAWGALVTAIVQSSTATTIATVGFVSAGLLTFTQSIGVVFGANLGTTSTGWIVSQLGFKVSLGTIAPPLVLIGVAARLLGRDRWSQAGMCVAGFGLLFVGIDMLQAGMATLAERVNPADLPRIDGDAWLTGRLLLIGFGFAMTVVMQSSSAAMTATLAALAAGAIDFEQAAALSIGQNVGTTPKALIASIGGPVAAKRTALAHVLFNVATGAVALATLPLLVRAVAWITGADDASDQPTELAFFHTAFNLIGVLVFLPIIGPFARLIERVIPDRAASPRSTLPPALAEVGAIGLEAARRALHGVLAEATHAGAALIARGGRDPHEEIGLADAKARLEEIRGFVLRIGRGEQRERDMERQVSYLHAIDHLDRLLRALRERTPVRGPGRSIDDPVVGPVVPVVVRAAERIAAAAQETLSEPRDPTGARAVETAARASAELAETRRVQRARAFERAASGDLAPELAIARVEALLWLDRVAYHQWRAAAHLLGTPSAQADERREISDADTGSALTQDRDDS